MSDDYFEAPEAGQAKYMEQLLKLVRRYSERSESSEDERLRWSKARFAAAMIARATGHMDTDTFRAEARLNAAWLAWAVGGVLCPPESQLINPPEGNQATPEGQNPNPPGATSARPSAEQIRKAQEYARQRTLETSARENDPAADPKKKLH